MLILMDNFSICFLTVPASSPHPSRRAVRKRKSLFFLYYEPGEKPPHYGARRRKIVITQRRM